MEGLKLKVMFSFSRAGIAEVYRFAKRINATLHSKHPNESKGHIHTLYIVFWAQQKKALLFEQQNFPCFFAGILHSIVSVCVAVTEGEEVRKNWRELDSLLPDNTMVG